ncbi:putative Glutathione synthase [Rhodotorula taiwanensis]|uniref:Glutathione synthetase n=1 Tax=Rhodotorula taiwanensis TaxID=741276 RepID=A0A2S5B272_9BASI|nr:putative Glutathione synthase [Rhodotorula taiwanensis]
MASQDWPPQSGEAAQAAVLDLACDWALANGLVLRPQTGSPAATTLGSKPGQLAIHAPFALYPSAFPRRLFQQALALQPVYNQLYADVTVDDRFLEHVIGGAVSKVDEFQGRLYEIWKQVKREGIMQPLSLGLFRSDYLVHAPTDLPAEQHSIKQVEFNTISASFAALSTRVGDLHRYLEQSGAYPPHAALSTSAIPENGALAGLASGLAAAHKAYGNDKAVVMMVIQDHERNAFDQWPLAHELLLTHGVRMVRVPFSELRTTLSHSPAPDYNLLYTPPTPFGSLPTPLEISVVYWRTAYAPTDYYTSAEWDTRLFVEQSRAIKCPSVGMQLAGAKKVQQVLAEPAHLDRFVPDDKDRAFLRESFTDLYPLDDSDNGKIALDKAYRECEKYVLKPQREGGGNNVYRTDIPAFLDQLAEEDKAKGITGTENGDAPRGREGYILMSLIESPQGMEQVLVKAGEARGTRAKVISELGVYGVVLLREDVDNVRGGKAELLVNETVGHLLRTKPVESDEGGVATGFSVIDSPLLV